MVCGLEGAGGNHEGVVGWGCGVEAGGEKGRVAVRLTVYEYMTR